ncbi:efflux RND transporter periplasmic adaptor subunit [Burkholderia ubonensis]|uniref:efflux RND transporter periplasmic adaptor subunit n=1 Tax=Burkholderia ubonensis TaxID=101571 RepID=UPI0007C7A157|nr:HlyD family efflux transporter periplasmic adaptor subunit [Burkholderia ubonensis]
MTRKWIFERRRVVWAGAGISVGLAVLALLHVATGSNPDKSAKTVHWIRVEPRPVEIRLGLAGHIAPAVRLTLTAPFSGSIADLRAVDGQQVKSGDTLLTLDTTQVDIRVREAFSDVLKARRALRNAEHWDRGPDVSRARRAVATAQLGMADVAQKLSDTRQLLTRGIVSRSELESLEQQERLQRMNLAGAQSELNALVQQGGADELALARNEVQNAEARYAALARARERVNVTAPFSGVVAFAVNPGGTSGRVPLGAGSQVSEGQALITLSSVERVSAVASVNETDISQLTPGQRVEVSGDSFENIQLPGRIESVGAEALDGVDQAGVGRYKVKVSLAPLAADQIGRILIGMSARLSIVVYRNERAIVVPPTTIVTADGRSFVRYRSTANAPIEQRAVRIGHATPDGVEIFGIQAGEVASEASDGA